MQDLNAERLSVTNKPFKGNTSDTDRILDKKDKIKKRYEGKVYGWRFRRTEISNLNFKIRESYWKIQKWNSQLDDGTITYIDFDRDTSSLEFVPNSRSNVKETHYSQIYISESEKQVFEAKTKELNRLKEQNIFIEEDSGQPCISVRWVIRRKVVDGSNMTEARLC